MQYREIAAEDAAERLDEALRQAVQAAGKQLTATALRVFCVVASRKDPTVAEVVRETKLTSAGVHKIVDRLGGGDQGLIAARPDPTDSRRVQLRLTATGERLKHDLTSALLGNTPRSKKELIIRLNCKDEKDRIVFRQYDINPDLAFVFPDSSLLYVIRLLGQISAPLEIIKESPFGGFALSFEIEDDYVAFLVYCFKGKL